MKLTKKNLAPLAEGDMTPMIDMTFQLIAFFMVLINFSEGDQDQRIRLPASELAKPPEGPLEEPRFIQITKDDLVVFGGDLIPVTSLQPLLQREIDVMVRNDASKAASSVTVIIRADLAAKIGPVQEVIQVCQKVGFEKFALRAKAEE